MEIKYVSFGLDYLRYIIRDKTIYINTDFDPLLDIPPDKEAAY